VFSETFSLIITDKRQTEAGLLAMTKWNGPIRDDCKLILHRNNLRVKNKNWLLHNDEICTFALRGAGTDPHGCTCRLNQVLHIDVPEGKFIVSHGEFDPL
jgi:hypothetical protein